MSRVVLCCAIAIGVSARSAGAQPPQPQPPPTPIPSIQATTSQSTPQSQQQEQNSDSLWVDVNRKHYIRQGHVEIHDAASKTDIYADLVEFFEEEDRAVATGNVVVSQGNNRISAERAEFNTKTQLGTFYNASGIATLQPQRQQVRPGMIAPPTVAGENVVYFFGETVEKTGPKKYKILNGGFSTCVQPTPRWDMQAGEITLNVDHYTLLKNAVMTVKGVPMLYLPILYYPTKRGERATGFLLPTYGSSTLRGQSIHNAFFWAIDRSQDATVYHDWFSKTGQGVGSEYRYNFGGGADGNIRAYLLDQHETTYLFDNGQEPYVQPASRYYEVHGGANQVLPGNLRARGRVDYVSSIATAQTFNTNLYTSALNQRTYGGNVIGAWSGYSLNATLDHTEYFYDANNSALSGSWPRVSLNRNERPILGSQVYFSAGTEYAHLLHESRATDTNTKVETVNDLGVGRLDFSPQIRYPFKKWGWLTANTTLNFRDTYYTRIYALDADGQVTQNPSDEGFNRHYLVIQSQITGPVFNRIWDTPSNGYAEKFKHSIEPFLTIAKTTNVENFDRIIYTDGVDFAVGGTQYTYGVTNRLYAKRKLVPGQAAQAREIVSIDLRQTYYTNQNAASLDRTYQSSVGSGTTDEHFSPIALAVRAVPSNDVNATATLEFDSKYHKLRTISLNSTLSWAQQIQTTLGWSKKNFIAEREGFNQDQYLDQYLNGNMTARTKDNRYGTTYTFYYDIHRSTMTQQGITGFYNAQCCGIAFQYQTSTYAFSTLPADHRFFLSFTLAGLGNFSPFNGAMSGVPR